MQYVCLHLKHARMAAHISGYKERKTARLYPELRYFLTYQAMHT